MATALRIVDPAPSNAPVADAGEIRPKETGVHRASILIVDDDPRNLFAVEEVLRDLGHRIVQARSGDEALLYLLREEFAVILLDIQMPGLDGYETADLVRAREKTRHVPIIFLTAVNKDSAQVFRGYAAGAVDYMFKPIDPIILRSKVSVFVELYEKTQEVKRQAQLENELLRENLRIRAEKMRADQALRRREQEQALIIRTLPLALWSQPLDPAAGGRRFITDNIERLTGFAAERFAAEPELWSSRLLPGDAERLREAIGQIEATGSFTLEHCWRRADGRERYFLDHAVVARTESGEPAEIVGIWLDVSERKQLEHQLLHAQKMEAIGQLTGGIAHDFNNMLSIIIGNLELLESHVADETGARRAKMALEGALRCASMTKRLLTFARRQPLQAKTIELNGFVEGMLELARRMLADTAEFRFTPVERLWPLKTDPTQLEAALVNLAVNARDAMPEGGVISFELRNVPWEEMPREAAELAEGDYVMIAVSDTGGGMDAETLERVFEPFFTTKEIGRGTGLGLSTTYGFVKQAGGHIAIESAPGEGTTVRLWLPRGDGAAAEPAREPADVARARGETVLVVEDEEAVREVAVTALSRLGYSVIEADTAERGLQLLEETPEIELLFTDVLMPGPIDGRALARAARRIRPAIKVLYASGYGGDVAEEDAPFLRKPYLGDDLAQRVRDVLDGIATEPEPV